MQEHLDVRSVLEGQIEHLIDLLDIMDGDPDLELEPDFEPSLGGAQPNGEVDLEADSSDDEPSLGEPDRMVNQAKWGLLTPLAALYTDAERDNCDREDGGDLEPEETDGDLAGSSDNRELDDADREASLGASNPHEDLGQLQWAAGNPGGSDEEQAAPSGFARVRRQLAAEHDATLEASRRLREILTRMSGVPEPRGNLRPVCLDGLGLVRAVG